MNKLIGAVFLFASALFCACYLISREKRRMKILRGFTDLIGEIYKQIEMLNLPIPEILSGADRDFLLLCGAADGDKITLERLVDLTEDVLTAREKELILSFSAGLGRCYRDEQLKLCKYYYGEIGICLEKLKSEYPKKRRLIFTLSICAALGVIILII